MHILKHAAVDHTQQGSCLHNCAHASYDGDFARPTAASDFVNEQHGALLQQRAQADNENACTRTCACRGNLTQDVRAKLNT